MARRQLVATGLTADQIRVRLGSGRLHEVHRGVYLAGHTVPPRFAQETAALLACGWDPTADRPIPAAALSHRSAAALWEPVS